MFLFASLVHPDQIVLSSASNEEIIETGEKTIKTTSIANEAKINNKSRFDYSL